jgi:hypothetical protein
MVRRTTPRQVILDVLANSEVKSEFTHGEIAKQILDCFSVLHIFVTTPDERAEKRDKASAVVGPAKSGPVENLQFTISRFEGEKEVEILGRLANASPAILAYETYKGSGTIVLSQSGREMRRRTLTREDE